LNVYGEVIEKLRLNLVPYIIPMTDFDP